MPTLTFYQGAILNPKSDTECDYIPSGLLVVKKGKIVDLLDLKAAHKKYGKIKTVKVKGTIMPGFFDMHFHWVQDDVRQMPKDSLLGWLDKYTFPAEMKFSDRDYAKKKAKIFFKKLALTGTLGGACYSSIHEGACKAAMKEVKGDFVIGNVLMNMNSPLALTQSDEASLKLTKKLIKKYGKRHAFTPRFAISTSPQVMKKGARLADKAKCFKQTHLSETPQEIAFVLALYKQFPDFKNVKSYTEIYEKTGMLGPRSLMGHGIHLSPKELKTLARTKTAVIHCPTSNAPHEEYGLDSGLFNFRQVEKYHVRWAMGSDIGGGPFLSMFDVMRSFVLQNKKAGVRNASFVKALFRSTLAGAEILGVADKTGNLDIGKEANFIVVKKKITAKDAESFLTKLILPYSGKRSNYEKLVAAVYLKGKAL